MSKRIKITEHQLSLIVNHINENKDSELLEEGWKDIVLGLTLLANIAGVKAQTVDVSSGDIESAELVQNKLPSKITDDNKDKLLKYFEAAEIEMSDENLEKLKNVDSERIDTFDTKYPGTASNKIKKGWAIDRVEVTSDTTWKDLPGPAAMDTSLSTDLSGDMYNSGDYELNNEGKKALKYIVDGISYMGGDILSVHIVSSTDMEGIQPSTAAKLEANEYEPTNDGLAKARKDGAEKYLQQLGVSVEITFELTPEQGPDVYGGKSKEERDSLHPTTAEFRKTTVDFVSRVTPEGDATIKPIIETIERFYLVKKGSKKGSQSSRSSRRVRKTNWCKIVPSGSDKKVKGLGCSLFK
tara:strand:+ start:1489 stop:2550 length:1062 start_codon:yes stop_codon:yes gene_type:complete